MRKTLIALLVVLCASLLAVSCRNSAEEARTSLSLKIEDGEGSRTIMPSQTLLDVQKYSITGSGPLGAVFGPVLSTDSVVSIKDLAVGKWTITAKALNAQNNELAEGEGTFTISKGENEATIVLDDMTGTGTLQLNFKWSSDICTETEICILIKVEDSKGNVITKTREISKSVESATVVMNLDAGCHVLNVQVQDSSGNIGIGATDAVRIVANTRSTGTIELKGSKPSDPSSGSNGTSLSIDNRIGTPMNFYIDYYPKNLSKGKFTTLNACYTNLPIGVTEKDLTYQWYRDGVLMSPASADNISFMADEGVHRYDVIVKSSKEGTLCGASLNLNVSN